MSTSTEQTGRSVVPITAQLRQDLRAVAVEHVSNHPEVKVGLARLLGVGSDSIEDLMAAPNWDLQLAMRVLSFLEVPVRVSRA